MNIPRFYIEHSMKPPCSYVIDRLGEKEKDSFEEYKDAVISCFEKNLFLDKSYIESDRFYIDIIHDPIIKIYYKQRYE